LRALVRRRLYGDKAARHSGDDCGQCCPSHEKRPQTLRYFLDTEFNGFGGALISLALVPEHGDQDFYVSLPLPDDIHPWVQQHVIPYLRFVPPGIDYQLSREHAAQHIEAYLAHDADPVIIADWPEDLAHFCQLLVTGPGQMIGINGMHLELVNGAGFSAAVNSKTPHNALHDAHALRDFYLGTERV
jgi:hypothetical protein